MRAWRRSCPLSGDFERGEEGGAVLQGVAAEEASFLFPRSIRPVEAAATFDPGWDRWLMRDSRWARRSELIAAALVCSEPQRSSSGGQGPNQSGRL